MRHHPRIHLTWPAPRRIPLVLPLPSQRPPDPGGPPSKQRGYPLRARRQPRRPVRRGRDQRRTKPALSADILTRRRIESRLIMVQTPGVLAHLGLVIGTDDFHEFRLPKVDVRSLLLGPDPQNTIQEPGWRSAFGPARCFDPIASSNAFLVAIRDPELTVDLVDHDPDGDARHVDAGHHSQRGYQRRTEPILEMESDLVRGDREGAKSFIPVT